MTEEILKKIEACFQEPITHFTSVGGGCIATTQLIQTNSGKQYFLKSGYNSRLFINEANGLNELRKATCINIPEVIQADQEFLLLEAITPGQKTADFWTIFGQQYARLHQFTGDSFGFYENNYIGATPQINLAEGDEKRNWIEFYFNKRLSYQFHLAKKNGFSSPEFIGAFRSIENTIASILAGSEEPPSLLHGDLWSGNYMVNKSGQAVLIDPAVYYGHREADLAMTHLFGGFPQEFYQSYQNTFPLKDGHLYRLNIYLLYHVLNHLNLFGHGYYGQALTLMNSYR